MSEKNGSYVTLSQLNDKLDKMRWEVRLWIVLALIAGQLVPARDVAQAAIHFLP